jgi:hypothetical protein
MQKGVNSLLAATASLLVFAGSVSAHHSFAAIFDKDQPITVSGVLVRVEWSNPHMFFYIDVEEDNGEVVRWAFEGYPPSMMVRQGWSRDTVKPGDRVTMTGWRARSGERPLAGGNRMTLPDGRILAVGASSEAENR